MNVRASALSLLLLAFGALSVLILLPFLTYVLAALLLAFVLYPLQQRLSPTAGSKVTAFSLVTGAVVATVVPLGLLLRYAVVDALQFSQNVERIPPAATLQRALERRLGVSVPLESALADLPRQLGNAATQWGVDVVSAGIHFALGVLLFVFLLYYLLKDGDALVAWTRDVTPLPEQVQDELYDSAAETTWAVLKGHVFVAIAQGVAAGAGLFVVGIPNAAFWTVVMVFLGFLPIIGVPLVWAPAAVYLAVNGRVLAGVALALYGVTLVAAMDDYLRAKLVDRASSLHAAPILLGALGGVYVLGAMGLFFGPIVLGLFKATVEVFTQYYADPT